MKKITKKEFTKTLSENLSILASATGYNQRFLDINAVDLAIQKSQFKELQRLADAKYEELGGGDK